MLVDCFSEMNTVGLSPRGKQLPIKKFKLSRENANLGKFVSAIVSSTVSQICRLL